VVKMLKDPVTQCYTGHALVKMQSHKQAEHVVSDLNEMIFTVSMGPRPLQASVTQAGQWNTKREATIAMGKSAIGNEGCRSLCSRRMYIFLWYIVTCNTCQYCAMGSSEEVV